MSRKYTTPMTPEEAKAEVARLVAKGREMMREHQEQRVSDRSDTEAER